MAMLAMLAISQKPERVLNILRSSTCVTRFRGTPWLTGTSRWRFSVAMAVMSLLLLVGRSR